MRFLQERLQTWDGSLKSTYLQFSRCHIFVKFQKYRRHLIAHYDDTMFWISAGTNKDDLEWPWMPDSTKSALNVRMLWLSQLAMCHWMNMGLYCQRQKYDNEPYFTAYEVCTNFRQGLLQRGRRTGVEPLNLVINRIMQHHLSDLEVCGRFL